MRGFVALWFAAVVGATPCQKTGAEPPSVVTLMASKDTPKTEAWVVSPDCSVQVVKLELKENSGTNSMAKTLSCYTTVERIDSIPSDTERINANGAKLTSGADLTAATGLNTVQFVYNSLSRVDNIKFPSALSRIIITENSVSSLKNVQLPTALKSLDMSDNQLTAIDFSIPNGLVELSLSSNPITKLEGLVLPDSLTSLGLNSNAIRVIKGVNLPRALQTLGLDSQVSNFEIRESDVAVLSRLTGMTGASIQSSCDPPAQSRTVGGMKVCVISDTLFNQLYRGGSSSGVTKTPTTVTNAPAPDTGSSGGSNEPTNAPTKKPSNTSFSVPDSDSSGSAAPPTLSASSRNGQDEKAGSFQSRGSEMGSSGSVESESPEARRGGRDASPDFGSSAVGTTTSSTHSKSSLLLIVLIVGGVVLVVIAVILFRVFVTSKRFKGVGRDSFGKNEYAVLSDTPNTSSAGTAGTQTERRVPNHVLGGDVITDETLLPFHIDASNIRMGNIIARGGFGIIYHGLYIDRDVAIKQLAPECWRDESMRANFVSEIRMSSRLDHPRIVEFVGITWNKRQEVAVILEYMKGGDLHQHLCSQAVPSAFDWSHSWGTTPKLKPKTAIAQDVAEAITYLHSFNSPILHRDLKARNVLVDRHGNAKLSDFGISREMAFDETMTGEIGTAAWIAPEVLRGERYSEKADIYSFGVLLVEMELCRHPFDTLIGDSVESSVGKHGASTDTKGTKRTGAMKKAQVIVSVSTGEWRPRMSANSPHNIQVLADACLGFEPETRPSAMELFYKLRQMSRPPVVDETP